MPKKSAANKKRREVGSSSNQGYDSHFFTSIDTFELFERKFKAKKLILGKKIMFGDFVGFNLKDVYDYMGWTGLCVLEGRVVPRMIRKFFANLEMSRPNRELFTVLNSYVDGKRIEICERILFEVLGIQNHGPRVFVSKSHPNLNSFDQASALQQITGNPNYPIDQTPRNSELIPFAKILHSLNTYIFLPRSGHREAVNLMDVYLLDRLLNRHQTNLPHIIINHIYEAYKSPSNRLPYAFLIQKIIEHHGVFVDENNDDIESLGVSDFLGERYLKGLGFKKGRDNRWNIARNPRPRDDEEGEEDEDGEDEEVGEEGQDTLEFLRSDFNEFRGSVFEHFRQQQEFNTNINRAFTLQEEYQRQQQKYQRQQQEYQRQQQEHQMQQERQAQEHYLQTQEYFRQSQASHEEMMRMFQSMYPRPPPDA